MTIAKFKKTSIVLLLVNILIIAVAMYLKEGNTINIFFGKVAYRGEDAFVVNKYYLILIGIFVQLMAYLAYFRFIKSAEAKESKYAGMPLFILAVQLFVAWTAIIEAINSRTSDSINGAILFLPILVICFIVTLYILSKTVKQ